MFTVPKLLYDYDALGESISTDIMKLHHDKHHQTYVDKLNAAYDQLPEAVRGRQLTDMLADLDSIPSDIRTLIRNNGGGHYNHSLFWQYLSPASGGEPSGQLRTLIEQKYGSFQQFVDVFTTQALGVFGSGWVWLLQDGDIITTPNQDTPIMLGKGAPIIGLDVWEHAYYLDYKNKRDDYISAWWDVANWQFAATKLEG